jgi:hypothetical protein
VVSRSEWLVGARFEGGVEIRRSSMSSASGITCVSVVAISPVDEGWERAVLRSVTVSPWLPVQRRAINVT